MMEQKVILIYTFTFIFLFQNWNTEYDIDGIVYVCCFIDTA